MLTRTLRFPIRAFLLSFAALASNAHADDTINTPGDHPNYSVEIEPRMVFGWDIYSRGFGAGAHFSFPIVKNGFISGINNSVALGIGANFLVANQRYKFYDSGTMFLVVPATVQWNLFVARHWSIFPELGVSLYNGFFDCGGAACGAFGLRPVLEIGARYHFNDKTAFTFRIGYPFATIGISIFQ